MQRPTRIVVFAVLCLLVGFFSGLSNAGELLMAVAGPSFVQSPGNHSAMQALPKQMRESNEASAAALKQPAYRVALGVEAAVSLVMAGVLVVAGIGLLLDKFWALRLTRVWGYYALVASAYAVVLIARFVLPQMPADTRVPPGAALFAAACCAMPMLWLFPVLLLTMLGRPVVRDYLRWREAVGRGLLPAGPAAGQMPGQPAPRPMADPPQTTATDTDLSPPRDRPAQEPPPGHQTWRDDPWNDPDSR